MFDLQVMKYATSPRFLLSGCQDTKLRLRIRYIPSKLIRITTFVVLFPYKISLLLSKYNKFYEYRVGDVDHSFQLVARILT